MVGTYSSEVIREFPFLVSGADIGTVHNEQCTQLGTTLLSSFVKRGKAPAIGGVDKTAVLD